jgi:hypothetical protein
MKFTPEQLIDWFIAASSQLPMATSQSLAEFRTQWLAMLDSPPMGTTRSEVILGMKQGINDVLAMAKDWPAEDRKRIDDALVAKGMPSLRKMEARLKKKHQRILARGRIKNDEEFYIVAEILSDSEFDISESDRSKLGKISFTYETRGK